MNILQEHVQAFRVGRDLSGSDAELFLDDLIAETDEALLDDVFRAWDQKGIATNEIYEIARIMRERCTTVTARDEKFVDIVGTGGSRSKTFNVSTAAAFVIAGAGVPVAKHGNRAATSTSGSADVLSELGVEPAVDAATAERCLNEIGICFMFAPNFHRLSPTLGKVRRGLGFPTIFNCVGPLCNPANAPYRLIGVWEEDLVPKVGEALSRLGTGKSWIVHGRDGMDEVSLGGATLVVEIEGSAIRRFEITPKNFGISVDDVTGLKVGSPEESANLIREVLKGERRDMIAERLVLINAAAGLYIAGAAGDLREGFRIATQSIRNGKAMEKLGLLAGITNE